MSRKSRQLCSVVTSARDNLLSFSHRVIVVTKWRPRPGQARHSQDIPHPTPVGSTEAVGGRLSSELPDLASVVTFHVRFPIIGYRKREFVDITTPKISFVELRDKYHSLISILTKSDILSYKIKLSVH